MMDVNLLLYLFLFRIDEPKNLTAEKNRRGGRISRGKHTQLNSVECMIFGFYNPASPAVAFFPESNGPARPAAAGPQRYAAVDR